MKSKPIFLIVKTVGKREYISIRRSDRTIQHYLDIPNHEIYKVGKKLNNGTRI